LSDIHPSQMNDGSIPLYAVRNWDKHFENSESRRYKSLTWVPVLNKHDGKGYRRIVQHPKSIQVFCAFILIVEVASKMPVRGLLADDDGPLTTSDLSAKTGFPEHIFDSAFSVLIEKGIGWIELVSPADARRFPQMPNKTPRIESKRTEQNRTEQNNDSNKEAVALKALPKADRSVELMASCRELMGDDELKKWHKRWLKRADEEPERLASVLGELKIMIREKRIETTPAKCAEDLWKRFE